MSETGETTLFALPPSLQLDFIDSESLPTGIVSPSAGASSSPTVRTVAYSAASSPGSPHAAIQFAERRMSSRAPMSAAAMLVTASPIASRPEAGASSSATGVRSPIAIASPV